MRKFYLFFCRYVLVLLFLFVTATAWSQSKTVTGKVTSEDDGAGIPGANVLEKGTSNGTVTDANGSYSITTASRCHPYLFLRGLYVAGGSCRKSISH